MAIAEDGSCDVDGAEDCTACKAGYGFVSDNSTCEECQQIAHPEYNNATDNSPCGQHTACGADQRFVFSANSSGKDSCESCAAGKYQSETSHFLTSCEVCFDFSEEASISSGSNTSCTACTSNLQTECTSTHNCSIGYHTYAPANGTCTVNLCSCTSGGDPATGANCTSDKGVICGTCKAGYTLNGQVCDGMLPRVPFWGQIRGTQGICVSVSVVSNVGLDRLVRVMCRSKQLHLRRRHGGHSGGRQLWRAWCRKLHCLHCWIHA